MKGKIEARMEADKSGKAYVTKKGDPYVRYMINGEYGSDFGNSQFPVGVEVEYDKETKGQFVNFNNMRSANLETVPASELMPNPAVITVNPNREEVDLTKLRIKAIESEYTAIEGATNITKKYKDVLIENFMAGVNANYQSRIRR